MTISVEGPRAQRFDTGSSCKGFACCNGWTETSVWKATVASVRPRATGRSPPLGVLKSSVPASLPTSVEPPSSLSSHSKASSQLHQGSAMPPLCPTQPLIPAHARTLPGPSSQPRQDSAWLPCTLPGPLTQPRQDSALHPPCPSPARLTCALLGPLSQPHQGSAVPPAWPLLPAPPGLCCAPCALPGPARALLGALLGLAPWTVAPF